jgi:CheY-like chemotaxis protein
MSVSDDHLSGESADILLVEDNPGDIRLTREAFEESHIANTLHVVTDGVEALDFLYRRGEYEHAPTPDIVLLDLNLPRKNGEEVLEAINEEIPDLSAIPVIVLTSSEAEEDVARSYELQANAYLTKPVDPVEFIETVKRFKEFWLDVVRLPPVVEDR